MKNIKKSLFIIIIIISITTFSYSHSGRTDSKGGHYDHSTGEYHYHHGYPAHQHPNGICPYENNKNETQKSEEIFKYNEIIDFSFEHPILVLPIAFIIVYSIISFFAYLYTKISGGN